MTTTHVTIKVKQLPEGVFLATSDDVPGLQYPGGDRHRGWLRYRMTRFDLE